MRAVLAPLPTAEVLPQAIRVLEDAGGDGQGGYMHVEVHKTPSRRPAIGLRILDPETVGRVHAVLLRSCTMAALWRCRSWSPLIGEGALGQPSQPRLSWTSLPRQSTQRT
jgi:hypothetical protein